MTSTLVRRGGNHVVVSAEARHHRRKATEPCRFTAGDRHTDVSENEECHRCQASHFRDTTGGGSSTDKKANAHSPATLPSSTPSTDHHTSQQVTSRNPSSQRGKRICTVSRHKRHGRRQGQLPREEPLSTEQSAAHCTPRSESSAATPTPVVVSSSRLTPARWRYCHWRRVWQPPQPRRCSVVASPATRACQLPSTESSR